VPELMYLMTFILSLVLCFAVGVMLIYHLYGISHGETSVEAQDHDEYRRKARGRGEVRPTPDPLELTFIPIYRNSSTHTTSARYTTLPCS